MALPPTYTIMSLPPYILSEVFEYPDLSMEDLINFALTCKKFYEVVFIFKRVWRLKFTSRWPSLIETIECIDEFNWPMEAVRRRQCDVALRKKILEFSPEQSRRSDLGIWDFRVYDSLFMPELGAHSLNYVYVLDELLRLKQETDICKETKDYYLQKLHQYVIRKYLTHEWRKFTALPLEQQTKDWLVDILIQWFVPWSPLVTIEVRAKRNNRVGARIRRAITDYSLPISWASPEVIEQWNRENLKDTEWRYDEALPVFYKLSDKMFQYWSKDKIKRKEFKIIFGEQHIAQCIFFECIARRLGLNCEVYGEEQSVFYLPRIRWIPRYSPNLDENMNYECVCINPRACKEFLKQFKYKELHKRPKKTAVELFHRLVTKDLSMSGSFEGVLELLHMKEPRDVTIITRLINVYIKRRASIAGFIEALEDISSDENVDPSFLNNMSKSELLCYIEKCQNYEKKRKNETLKFSDWLIT